MVTTPETLIESIERSGLEVLDLSSIADDIPPDRKWCSGLTPGRKIGENGLVETPGFYDTYPDPGELAIAFADQVHQHTGQQPQPSPEPNQQPDLEQTISPTFKPGTLT